MYNKEKKNITQALSEVLEIGTDQSRIEYAKATPGQTTEIENPIEYVEKPDLSAPSYKALSRAVKEGKTPEEISQEFDIPVSYVKLMTGLQEGFISPTQLAEKVKDKMEFMKKKKEDKGKEDKDEDEDGNDDKPDFVKSKGDDGDDGDDSERDDDSNQFNDDDGEEDGDKEGHVMQMDKSKDEVEVDPTLDDEDLKDDDENCGCDDKKKKDKKYTKESISDALNKVLLNEDSKRDK